MKLKKVFSFFLILIIAAFVFLKFTSNPAKAAWFDDSFAYRRAITFSNGGAAVTNQKFLLDFDTAAEITAARIQSDCDDFRFTDANGRQLEYYFDSAGGACNTTSTDFYVLLPDIPAGANLFYAYFGNPTVPSESRSSNFTEATFSATETVSSTLEKSQGPISYWKFDEGYGTTIHDSTTNNNTATLSQGATTWWDATWTKRYLISSNTSHDAYTTNDFLGIQDLNTSALVSASELQSDCDDLRIVYQTTSTQTDLGRYVTNCNTSTSDIFFKVQAAISANDDIGAQSSYAYYVYYANASATTPPTYTNTNSIDAPYSDDADTEALWHLDETTADGCSGGEDSCDSSTNAIHLTSGSVAVEQNVTGRFGKAVHYVDTTTNTFSSAPDNANLDWAVNIDFTLEGWVKYDSATCTSQGDGMYLMTKRESSGLATNYYMLRRLDSGGGLDCAGEVELAGTTHDTNSGSGTDLNNTNWHHLAAVRSGGASGNLAIWIDGVQKNTETNHEEAASNAGPILLGGWNCTAFCTASGDELGNQTIDAVRISRVARTNFYHVTNEATTTVAASSAPTAPWKPTSSCLSGSCLQLSSTGYVSKTYSSDTELDPGTGSFSTSFWFRHNSTTPSSNEFALARYSAAGYKIYMNTSGNMCFGIDDDSTWGPDDSACNSSNLADSKWHFLTAVKNTTSTIQLYIDGQLAKTTTVTATSSISGTSPVLNIGIDTGQSSGSWNGYMDELKYYNYARSVSQIRAGFTGPGTAKGVSTSLGSSVQNLSSGLVGYWNMNESSGNVSDSSGNSLTLTNNGTTTFSTGKFGNAPLFNGSSKYFSTATTISNVYSVSFWAYPASTTDNFINLASGKYVSASSGIVSATGFTNPVIYINGVMSTTISASSWQLITVTSTSAISANAFEIGRANGSYAANNSLLDDIRVYNRALTVSEVERLYNWAPGPVAHWKLDENTGTTANDSSGNSQPGTITTGTPWIPGKFGSALKFNGSSQAVTATLNANPGYWNTVELWINPSTSIASKTIITNLTTDSSSQPVYGSCTGTAISLNTWTHIVATSTDSTHCSIYQNGVLTVSSATTGVTYGTTVNIASSSFSGIIDDVRIYNYARSAKQIVEDMNGGHPAGGSPIASQVVYYKFDEQNGTGAGAAHNSNPQQSSLTGNITEAAWKTETNCKLNGCLDFDGTNDVVTTTNASPIDFDLGLNTGVTFSAWINPDTIGEGSAGQIFFKGTNNYCQLGGSTPFNIACKLDLGTDATLTVNSILPASTWSHVALSWTDDSDDEITLWVNGKKVGISTDGVGPPSADTANLLIGGTTTNNFDGKIDEFKVYSSELTQAELSIDMNANSNSALGGVLGSHTNEGFAGNPPVAWYKTDENSGVSANDTSGNNLTGTLTNGPIWISGKNGQALKFDGSNDSVNINDNDVLDFTTAVTLEAWIKPDSPSPEQQIISKTNGSCADSWWLGLNSSKFTFVHKRQADCNPNQYVETSTINANQWYHVVGVFDGSTSYIYLNGKLEASNSTSPESIIANTTRLTLGARGDDTLYFKGLLDNVRIYNYARTPAQIAYDYNRGAPVAHYKFDECQGTTTYNSTGMNGTYSGTTAIGDCNTASTARGDGAIGKYNASIKFAGSDEVVTVSNASSIDLNEGLQNGLTISSWVYPTSAGEGSAGEIFRKTTTTFCRLGGSSPFNLTCNLDLGTDATLTVNSLLPVNTWSHVALSWTDDDDDEITLWTNGKKVGQSADGVGPVSADSSSLLIAGGSSNNFAGQIDDFKVFNYEMTSPQVQTLYNQGSAIRFGP